MHHPPGERFTHSNHLQFQMRKRRSLSPLIAAAEAEDIQVYSAICEKQSQRQKITRCVQPFVKSNHRDKQPQRKEKGEKKTLREHSQARLGGLLVSEWL